MPQDMSVNRQGPDITVAAFQEVKQEEQQEISAEKIAAEKSAQADAAENIQRPRTEKKEKPIKSRAETIAKARKEQGIRMLPVDKIKDSANKFQGRPNSELKSDTLVLLRQRLKEGASKEEILKLVSDYYSDPYLANEVLDFLLETTQGPLQQTVQAAKDDLIEQKEREIIAGRNIADQVRQATEKGLGEPTALRDMYRDITNNPRDAQTLFSELSQKYSFKELTKVIGFLFHSLGADMKSKGPSIPPGELSNLIAEVRTLQSIKNVYRFFQGRMDLMSKMFAKYGMETPPSVTFENMAKCFMNLVTERYPSSEKVKGQAAALGIQDNIAAQIVVFSQFRDAIREVQ